MRVVCGCAARDAVGLGDAGGHLSGDVRDGLGGYILGYLDKGIQTPMAQGRSAKII